MSNEQSRSRSESLKPCPFCGGVKLNTFGHFVLMDGGTYRSRNVEVEKVQCMDCKAEATLNGWNARATVSETAASVGWIPISERTPPSDYVLAADSYYGHARMGQYSEHMKAWLFLTPNGRSEAVGVGRVTHWMPLPEAPK